MTSTKFTTVRFELVSNDDHSSEVPRAELESALVQLIVTSGVSFNLHGFTYALTDAQVVGR